MPAQDAPKRTLLVVCAGEEYSDRFMQACERVKPAIALNYERTLKSALTNAVSSRPMLIAFLWDDFESAELAKYIQKFRRFSELRASNFVFVISRPCRESLAMSLEYEIYSVVTSKDIAIQLPAVINDLTSEYSVSSRLRGLEEQLEQAKRIGSWPVIEKAVTDFYSKFPMNQKAMIEFGNLRLRKNDFAQAEAIALNVLAKYPHDLRASNLLARVKMHIGKFDEAMAVLKDAEILSPMNLDRLVTLGDVYRQTGNNNEAKTQYGWALEIDEDNRKARLGLANVEAAEGNFNQAMAVLRNAAGEDEVASMFNNSGVVAARRKDFKSAYRLYLAALKALKKQSGLRAKVFFNIGLSKLKEERFSDAAELFALALKHAPAFDKASRYLQDLVVQGFKPSEAAPLLDAQLDEGFLFEAPQIQEESAKALRAKNTIKVVEEEMEFGNFAAEVVRNEDS